VLGIELMETATQAVTQRQQAVAYRDGLLDIVTLPQNLKPAAGAAPAEWPLRGQVVTG
jgi:hypothetical protein